MYCTNCGQNIETSYNFCPGCGCTLQIAEPKQKNNKEALLETVGKYLETLPNLRIERYNHADFELFSDLANANWKTGKVKIDFYACLKADEKDNTVYYYEILKEVRQGLGFFSGFKVETYKSDGKQLFGNVKELQFGPGGKIVDYDWDYSKIRSGIERTVNQQGWKFKLVLWKNKAMY
ncbi:MAG: zinc ribbon domain-containing protein [Negativicutes bacterium]|nr:zinc ribbon domain-containing protein [Negativicutes bacterium]